MKAIRSISLGLFIGFLAASNPTLLHAQQAEANPCDQLHLDLEKGTLNGLTGAASMEEVKKAFPCYSGETEENSDGINCGGGVFFLNHDFFIYTGKDYINVRNNFKGKTPVAILGQLASSLADLMGEPDSSFVYKDEFFEEETQYAQYAKDWGTLVLVIKDGSVQGLELHTGKKIGEIDFCF